jgi:predicted lipoprotein with Yx(FWY)xxD motif
MKIPTLILTAGALGLAGCATAVAPPPGPVTLTSASKAPFGSYVVDASGRALYVLEGSRGAPGTANRCSGACLQEWPPLGAAGPQFVGGRLHQGMVSVVPGYGGSQVAYAGWPLYHFDEDRAPSDTKGQHVTDAWGTWHLLSPSGQPIRPANSPGY